MAECFEVAVGEGPDVGGETYTDEIERKDFAARVNQSH